MTLLADAAGSAEGTLHVRVIELRRGAGGELLQRIEGLETETPWTAAAPGLEFIDLNFDGQPDLRLIERLPAGPEVPWLNWLYEPASGRFAPSPALNAIPALRVDAAHRELLSAWRDGPAREGFSAYAWRDGRPVLVRKEEREYTRPGHYTLRVWKSVAGQLKLVQTSAASDR